MNDYEDSSPLKMFLLISMVMVGVFLLGGTTEGSTVEGATINRDLMEVSIKNNGYIQEHSLMDT